MLITLLERFSSRCLVAKHWYVENSCLLVLANMEPYGNDISFGRKELGKMFMRFSSHDRSLIRWPPTAMTIGHNPKGKDSFYI